MYYFWSKFNLDCVIPPPSLLELVDGVEHRVKTSLDFKVVHERLYYLAYWYSLIDQSKLGTTENVNNVA